MTSVFAITGSSSTSRTGHNSLIGLVCRESSASSPFSIKITGSIATVSTHETAKHDVDSHPRAERLRGWWRRRFIDTGLFWTDSDAAYAGGNPNRGEQLLLRGDPAFLLGNW